MTLDGEVVGSREDPNAQIRNARSLPLLLHSMSVFREIFEIIFANRPIATVVEVGVESGQVSSLYTELGASAVYCVDPTPSDALRRTLAGNPALHLVEQPSPGVLADLPVADLYVLDGDHNYAVVHAELSWILKNAPDAVIAMHDVMWPSGRRDLYYEPSPLPAEQRHDYTDEGPTVWHDGVTPAGFVGVGAFTMAREAGGERNGVLTAVEDVLSQAENDGWLFDIVPAVFGMGLVMPKRGHGVEKIMADLRPYTTSRLLATLENNRIALYTRVLQMQYDAVACAANTDRMAEQITQQRGEIDALRSELDTAVAGRTEEMAEVAAVRAEIERLRHLLDQTFASRLGAKLRRMSKTAEPRIRRAINR